MRRLSLLFAALVVALAGTTACGDDDPGEIPSGGGTESNGSAGEAELSDDERALAFVQCLRENGADVPDPDPERGIIMRRDQTSMEEMQQAREACRHLEPEGLPGGQMDPEVLEQLRQFAQCMRDNGIDFPDPDPNGGGMRIGADDGIDPNSPEFEAAMEACEEFRAGLPSGGARR